MALAIMGDRAQSHPCICTNHRVLAPAARALSFREGVGTRGPNPASAGGPSPACFSSVCPSVCPAVRSSVHLPVSPPIHPSVRAPATQPAAVFTPCGPAGFEGCTDHWPLSSRSPGLYFCPSRSSPLGFSPEPWQSLMVEWDRVHGLLPARKIRFPW